MIWECEEQGIEPSFFLHDNDVLYPKDMDNILGFSDIETITTPFQAPDANAHAERFILSCKKECLNHLLIFGLNRLQRVLDTYKTYFNEHRPHQGIDNIIPAEYNRVDKQQVRNVLSSVAYKNFVRKDFLGGLLKSYQKVA